MDVYRELMAVTKERTGLDMTSKQAKVVFLGLLYGMGKDKLAGQLGTSPAEAQEIKDALMLAVPSIKEISTDVKAILTGGEKIRTWGGRLYAVEPPKLINGQMRTFEYKGLNVLVQGSASDETKEAVIRYAQTARDSRLISQVHDEIVISCHRDVAQREMANLRQAMEGLGLDVPMLSEGEMGYRWGHMVGYAE
jgi:DNA polymerase-1